MPGDIHGRSLSISHGQSLCVDRRNRDSDRLPARHRAARIRTDETRPESFDPIEEQPASEKPIQRLGAFLLAFYRKNGGQMDEIDAGRGLVDLLAAGA